MAKEKFTVKDIEKDLQRRSREAKASLSKPGLKKEYPNSDRYGEDGRYSAYNAPQVDRLPGRQDQLLNRRLPGRQVWGKRLRFLAIGLALVAAILFVIVMSALPH